MAKTKPKNRTKKSKQSKTNGASPKTSPAELLGRATTLLQTSNPDEALIEARRALALLAPTGEPDIQALPALGLLGEICVELGDVDTARDYFTAAALLDQEGDIDDDLGGGADKFLWLAQLCEEGGAESVQWFERGAAALRTQLGRLETKMKQPGVQEVVGHRKQKLANALCGCVEVYMTDLSWEEDAETRCENYLAEAMLVSGDDPEVLQTLASVRISQARTDEARSALFRSLALWKDLPPESPKIPEFPTRISLSRLLLECQMYEEALEVLESLVSEDDSSVEAWYLGGWCLYLAAEAKTSEQTPDPVGVSALEKSSRDWLQNSLKMYQMLDYEDERLKDHASELVGLLDKVLGPATEGDEDDEAEWEDASSGEDEEDETMQET